MTPERFPVLDAWLKKHKAKVLWSMDAAHAAILAYQINGHLVLVLMYAHAPSWDIFTAPSSALTERTLEDAERRVGLK